MFIFLGPAWSHRCAQPGVQGCMEHSPGRSRPFFPLLTQLLLDFSVYILSFFEILVDSLTLPTLSKLSWSSATYVHAFWYCNDVPESFLYFLLSSNAVVWTVWRTGQSWLTGHQVNWDKPLCGHQVNWDKPLCGHLVNWFIEWINPSLSDYNK